MNKLLIVDGNSIANRAFYALPFLSNHDGRPSGAVFGFANILIKLISQEMPSHIVIAFDHARKTFRNELYSEYKMQRKPTPEELISQFAVIKEMLSCMDIKVLEFAGIEADDIIGTIAKSYSGEKFIISGDRDLLQLIDDRTTVWLTKKGVSEVDKVDENRLKELYNLRPSQIIDLKALMGDSSDNIPGVKGIGEKTALTLLEKYDNLTNLYNNIEKIGGKLQEKLQSDKDMAFLSRQLATIKTDCDFEFNIDDCKLKFPFSNKAREFFLAWDFSSLAKNNDIFSSDIEPKQEVERASLTSEVLAQMSKSTLSTFCYNLAKMEFFFDDKIYFLESNFSMFDSQMSLEDVCCGLKKIFEDEQILKITCSAKSDMHILNNYSIKLNNYFDLYVGEYVINAGNKAAKEIPIESFESEQKRISQEISKQKLDFIYEKIEKPLIEILCRMEEDGFKINSEMLDVIDIEFIDKLSKLTKRIYESAGEEFNINSPKQVAHILFDKLGIKTYNNKKQSTRADILDELAYIPIVSDIKDFRKYSKLKNTYIDVYKNLISTSGDILHTTFNQTLTATGRLSSSEPNLQNIPTRNDEGKNLRKIFVSKFEGGKIISADYNQIELRLLADMSGEEHLIEAYKQGRDIHAHTASKIFGVPIDTVTESQRRDAKAVNFGIIYGISDYGLSQNIKTTRAKAKEYIDAYFARYPKVKLFMSDNVKFATEHGYAVTKFGRIRKIPELQSSKYMTRSFGERVAMNMPLQGTASDIIKLAMIGVHQEFQSQNLKSQLILQIHDELIVDTFPGEEKKVEKILKEQMESVIELKVPLVVSMGIGDSLYDCK